MAYDFYGTDAAETVSFATSPTGVTVNAGGGDDLVNGSSSADRINGGEGNDKINAGAGDDVINGGAGNDRLMGGSGNDTFQFNKGEIGTNTSGAAVGADQIVDFHFGAGSGGPGAPEHDFLQFGNFSSSAYLTLDGAATGVKNGYYLMVHDGDYTGKILIQIADDNYGTAFTDIHQLDGHVQGLNLGYPVMS